jgi:hypothetical protein
MSGQRIRIQPRDERIVRDVFLHRVARRDGVIALGHFDSVPRCNERLGQLARAGWLRRIDQVNGQEVRQGLYAVGPAAGSFLSESLQIPSDEISRQCTAYEGPLLIEHSIRILDFRLLLQEQGPDFGVQLEEWLCEAECLHEFQVRSSALSPWSSIVMKPDGYFRAGRSGEAHDFFVEIDLGHVSLPRFAEKLRRYERYLESGAFRDVYGSGEFTLLTVTVGERRLSHLASLSCRSVRHLVTTWSRIERSAVFASVWSGADADRRPIFHDSSCGTREQPR